MFIAQIPGLAWIASGEGLSVILCHGYHATLSAVADTKLTQRQFVEHMLDEIWHQRQIDAIDRFMSRDFIGHDIPDGTPGYEGTRAFWELMTAAFPKIEFQIHDTMEEGELITVRSTLVLTDKEDRTSRVTGVGLMRIRDGKLVEAWNAWNFLQWFESFGVIPKDLFVKTLKELAAKGE